MTAGVSTGQDYAVRPHFVETSAGQAHVLALIPKRKSGVQRATIVLPPFAEELNKSRRMIASLGYRLAAQGTSFVLPDLPGTGDSAGEFEEFVWSDWAVAIGEIADSMVSDGADEIDVVALRSGAYLLPALRSSRIGGLMRNVVFWCPVQTGSRMIDQFLRSKVIRDRSSTEPVSVASIRSDIEKDGDAEIAGYRLTRELLRSIDELTLETLEVPGNIRLLWLDVSPVQSDKVPPAAENIIEQWRQSGVTASYGREKGPQFWMTPEIELVPELVERTMQFLCR